MIQVIKNTYYKSIICLALLVFYSCKENTPKPEILTKKKTSINDHSALGKVRNNWIFYKTVSLSKAENVCDENTKFKSLIIDISKDSVFISNIYTDNVYRNMVLSESFFEHPYLFHLYKKMLKDKFEIILPNKIESIRNKRVYDKNSKLDKYFQDAFFIDNYMFVESDGCIVVFKKNNISQSEDECNDENIEMGSGKICTIKNSNIIKEYAKIISNNLVEESSVLPKKIPSTDSIISLNRNGLIDIEFKVKSNKIKISINYDGGMTEIILEKNKEYIKRGIYHYAD